MANCQNFSSNITYNNCNNLGIVKRLKLMLISLVKVDYEKDLSCRVEKLKIQSNKAQIKC